MQIFLRFSTKSTSFSIETSAKSVLEWASSATNAVKSAGMALFSIARVR